MDIISLFQSGGIVLVFIGFNVWLVRYFMEVVKRKDEVLTDLMEGFNTTVSGSLDALKNDVSHQTEILVRLVERIEMSSKR